jgi:hypothetical protein
VTNNARQIGSYAPVPIIWVMNIAAFSPGANSKSTYDSEFVSVLSMLSTAFLRASFGPMSPSIAIFPRSAYYTAFSSS